MLKSIKNIFNTKPKIRVVDQYNLLSPTTSIETKFQLSCHLLYEVLLDLGIIKQEKNNIEKIFTEFSDLYFDTTGDSDNRMYAYFKMIEGLDSATFNHLQTQEAIHLWEVFTLKRPLQGEDNDTMDYRFACNTIHGALIKYKIIEDSNDSYAMVCKALITPHKGELKYPILRSLIDYPESVDKNSKLHKALNIYIKLQDEKMEETK